MELIKTITVNSRTIDSLIEKCYNKYDELCFNEVPKNIYHQLSYIIDELVRIKHLNLDIDFELAAEPFKEFNII